MEVSKSLYKVQLSCRSVRMIQLNGTKWAPLERGEE